MMATLVTAMNTATAVATMAMFLAMRARTTTDAKPQAGTQQHLQDVHPGKRDGPLCDSLGEPALDFRISTEQLLTHVWRVYTPGAPPTGPNAATHACDADAAMSVSIAP